MEYFVCKGTINIAGNDKGSVIRAISSLHVLPFNGMMSISCKANKVTVLIEGYGSESEVENVVSELEIILSYSTNHYELKHHDEDPRHLELLIS